MVLRSGLRAIAGLNLALGRLGVVVIGREVLARQKGAEG